MKAIALAALVHLGTMVDTACNVCQQNQAACINSTSYHLCFGETTPYTEVLYHCFDGFDCTDLDAICVQTNNARQPSCGGDTSKCGLCSAHRNYLFACTGRNTFRMCYGAYQASGRIGYCPEGWLCDAESDAICVRPTEVNKITCDIMAEPPPAQDTSSTTTSTTNKPIDDTSSSTTTTPTITPDNTVEATTAITSSTTSSPSPSPSPLPMTPDELCALMGAIGLFPIVPRDAHCLRYVYCYRGNGVPKGIQRSCPIGTYYNIEREQCTLRKPAYCI